VRDKNVKGNGVRIEANAVFVVRVKPLRILRYLPGERGGSSSVKKFKDLLKPGEGVFERSEAHAALLGASATTSRETAFGAADKDHIKSLRGSPAGGKGQSCPTMCEPGDAGVIPTRREPREAGNDDRLADCRAVGQRGGSIIIT